MHRTTIRSFDTHAAAVYAIAFRPTMSQIISGSRDASVRLFDLRNNGDRPAQTLVGHTNGVMAVIAGEGRDEWKVVSGSYDKSIRVFDLRVGRRICTLYGHSAAVFSLSMDSDSNLFSGAADKMIRHWSFNTTS